MPNTVLAMLFLKWLTEISEASPRLSSDLCRDSPFRDYSKHSFCKEIARKTMIIVCFGLHKSASTLTYQTVLRLAALGSPAQLFWCEENWSQPNYGKVARINDRYLKK